MSIITLGISDSMSKQCAVFVGRKRISTRTQTHDGVEYYIVGGFSVERPRVVNIFMPRIAPWVTTYLTANYSISIAAIQHYDIIKHIIHNIIYKHSPYTLFGQISTRRQLATTIRAKSWRRNDNLSTPKRPLTIKKRVNITKTRIDLSPCSYIIVGKTKS